MATASIWLGIGAAVVTAFCQTATDIGTKAATREAEERLVVATQWCVGAVLLTALCLALHPELLLRPMSALSELTRGNFWPILFGSSVLNVVAYYFFVRAYRLSDASLAAPLLLITPVLMLDKQAPIWFPDLSATADGKTLFYTQYEFQSVIKMVELPQ